jgi:hypothetical protein
MITQREKKIESLRSQLASLEEELEREKKERETLDLAHEQLLSTLTQADLSFESFVRCFFKDVRRIVTRVEREQSKDTNKREPVSPTKKKKAVKSRKRRAKPRRTIKIPAGRYANVPAEPDKVFEVKEKGPRPKALKAYAEEIGLEALLNQCRLPDDG